MCQTTNKYPAECCVCKARLAPGDAVVGTKAGDWLWLCQACRDASPMHPPLKIIEAYYAQFSDEAGGPGDERDHEDFRIGERLVEAKRIDSYAGPFGEEITRERRAP